MIDICKLIKATSTYNICINCRIDSRCGTFLISKITLWIIGSEVEAAFMPHRWWHHRCVHGAAMTNTITRKVVSRSSVADTLLRRMECWPGLISDFCTKSVGGDCASWSSRCWRQRWYVGQSVLSVQFAYDCTSDAAHCWSTEVNWWWKNS